MEKAHICPKCHHWVVSVQELRDIRIEQKLDKIISLLVLMGADKAIADGDKLLNETKECDHIASCFNDGDLICSKCGVKL